MGVRIMTCKVREKGCGKRLSATVSSILQFRGGERPSRLGFFDFVEGSGVKHKPAAPEGGETFMWSLERPLAHHAVLTYS